MKVLSIIKIKIVKSQLTVEYHQANNVEERNAASGRWSAKKKIPSTSLPFANAKTHTG